APAPDKAPLAAWPPAVLWAPPAKPEPAHAVGHPGRPEPDLGVAEALVHRAQHGVLRHETVVEDQLDVAAEQALVERVDVPDHLHAGVVLVHQEHRRPAGLTGVS